MLDRTVYKCHILLYPIFEFLLDSFHVDYQILNDNQHGFIVDETDRIYPGDYIEYSVLSTEKDFVYNLLPFQPYEKLQGNTISNEISKYKDITLKRIEILNGSLRVKYFYNNVRQKECCIEMDYSRIQRNTIGNHPLRTKETKDEQCNNRTRLL